MNLTYASSYALHALAYMASQKTDENIASNKIAKEKGIPERFLLKVLKPLVNARVLDSVKGPKGGYRLAKPANKITLLEIIEKVDQSALSAVVPVPKKSKKWPKFDPETSMPLHNKLEELCQESVEMVRKHLEKVKLSDLIEE